MTPLNTFEFLELLLIQYIYILVEKQVSNSSMNNFRSTKRFEVNKRIPDTINDRGMIQLIRKYHILKYIDR